MSAHALDAIHLQRLRRIVSCRADQLVLDINAVYVVGPDKTVKIEAFAVQPESLAPNDFDEVFPIRVEVSEEVPRFDRFGEEGLAYRVSAESVTISRIDLVRVAVQFPSDQTLAASTADVHAMGVNIVDCGVLVYTDRGVLVAYQRHPGFGFHWGHHVSGELMPLEAALALVPPPYELVPLELA